MDGLDQGYEYDGHGDEEDERTQFLLLLLSDSNLPTGGFIASAGLESYLVHGLLTQSAIETHGPASSSSSTETTAVTQAQTASALLGFIGSSLDTYARSSIAFLADAHRLTTASMERLSRSGKVKETMTDTDARREIVDDFLRSFGVLDEAYHSLTLNAIARRASCAQGTAYLSLFSKAFAREAPLATAVQAAMRSRPRPARHHHAFVKDKQRKDGDNGDEERRRQDERTATPLLEALKLTIRQTKTPGHLPLAFGALTAALDVPLPQAAHLHLFLHARALLSSAVRLSVVGPYGAQRLLVGPGRALVRAALEAAWGDGQDDWEEDGLEAEGEQDVRIQPRTGSQERQRTRKRSRRRAQPAQGPTTALLPLRPPFPQPTSPTTPTQPPHPHPSSGQDRPRPVHDDDPSQGWAWDWPEDGAWSSATARGPTTTWPLGEIVQARHDALQSRLFNS